MGDKPIMQTLMSANTPTELMATRGRTFRDNAFKYFFNFVDDIKAGAGELAANRDFRKHVDTLEGQDLEDYDFSVSEQTRPLSQTEDFIMQNAPERYRNGGGVGSLNETARNMFRSYKDGGDISPVPSGEGMNLEEIREEMADRFGDTASQYGNENIEKGIGFFRSAGNDFEEGGGGHYIRQGADYLSDMGKAGIYSLAGVGEKGVALGAEVIDDIASRFINTSGEEKLTDDLMALISEAPVLGPLIGKAAQFPRVIKNKSSGLMSQKYKKPPDSSRMQSGADPFEIIKYMRRQSKLSQIDMLERNLKDVGRSADEIQKNIKMQTLIRDLQKIDVESKAGGGMVGIGAYQNYMV